MKITLREPVKFGEKTLSEITLREPTIGEVMQAMPHLDTDDQDSFTMTLVQLTATIQAQFVEEMSYPDLLEASTFLAEFPIVPNMDFRGKPVSTPMIVAVDPVITHGTKSLDSLQICAPKARMVRDANKVLRGEITLGKLQQRNYRLVKEITGVDDFLLQRVPVSTYRQAEDMALSFLSPQVGQS